MVTGRSTGLSAPIDRPGALSRVDHDPVALIQIGDALGRAAPAPMRIRARDRSRPRHSRRPAASRGVRRSAGRAAERKRMRERERAVEARLECQAHRLHRIDAGLHLLGDADGRPPRVSVWLVKTRPRAISSSRSALKFSMMPLWTTATSPVACGMGVVLGRRAMGGPARMGDAGGAGQRLGRQRRGRDCRACRAARRRSMHAVMIRRDAGQIITAIFEPPQPLAADGGATCSRPMIPMMPHMLAKAPYDQASATRDRRPAPQHPSLGGPKISPACTRGWQQPAGWATLRVQTGRC